MNDNTIPTENGIEEIVPTPQPKPPACRLSILSAMLFFIPVLMALFLAFFLDGIRSPLVKNVTSIAMFLACACVIMSPVVAISAKIRIALSDGRLRDSQWSNTALILLSLMFLWVGGSSISLERSIVSRIICGTNVENLSGALLQYAKDHDDQLPAADHWCDVLIAEADISFTSLICPESDAVEGESCYALNKFVAGKKLSQLPAGTVLLFETRQGAEGERDMPHRDREFIQKMPDLAARHRVHKDRWNQSGGPEDVYAAHKEGTNFGLADGHASYESIFKYPNETPGSGFEALCWDENKTRYKAAAYINVLETFEKQKPDFPNALIVLGAVIAAAGVCVMIYTKAWRYPVFCLTVAAAAAGTGFLFGAWADAMYDPEFFQGAGAIIAAILGGWLAPCYVGLLMKFQSRLSQIKSVEQLAAAFGMVTGILCSTLLHVFLIILYRDSVTGGGLMLAAMPFGMVAGGVLGILSGWIVCRYYRQTKEQVVETVRTEESV